MLKLALWLAHDFLTTQSAIKVPTFNLLINSNFMPSYIYRHPGDNKIYKLSSSYVMLKLSTQIGFSKSHDYY